MVDDDADGERDSLGERDALPLVVADAEGDAEEETLGDARAEREGGALRDSLPVMEGDGEAERDRVPDVEPDGVADANCVAETEGVLARDALPLPVRAALAETRALAVPLGDGETERDARADALAEPQRVIEGVGESEGLRVLVPVSEPDAAPERLPVLLRVSVRVARGEAETGAVGVGTKVPEFAAVRLTVTDAVAQPDAEKDALSVPESDAVTLSVAVGESDGERVLFAEKVADPGVGGNDARPETDGVVEGDAACVRVRGPVCVGVVDAVAHADADADAESALDAEPLPVEEGRAEPEPVELSESVRVDRGDALAESLALVVAHAEAVDVIDSLTLPEDAREGEEDGLSVPDDDDVGRPDSVGSLDPETVDEGSPVALTGAV